MSKDYHIDKDAAELQPATDDDDAEDMTAMFGQMGISNSKKCQYAKHCMSPFHLLFPAKYVTPCC